MGGHCSAAGVLAQEFVYSDHWRSDKINLEGEGRTQASPVPTSEGGDDGAVGTAATPKLLTYLARGQNHVFPHRKSNPPPFLRL